MSECLTVFDWFRLLVLCDALNEPFSGEFLFFAILKRENFATYNVTLYLLNLSFLSRLGQETGFGCRLPPLVRVGCLRDAMAAAEPRHISFGKRVLTLDL